MLDLESAIKHCEEVAKEQRELFSLCPIPSEMCDPTDYCASLKDGKGKGCIKCAEEHEQLAEWLKDYKRLLEQEPCEDCVSRKEVKEKMLKYGFKAPDMTVTEFVEDELPPVRPEEKVGYWIHKKYSNGSCYECSECGGMAPNYDCDSTYAEGKHPTDYCPKCGAKMKGVENEI